MSSPPNVMNQTNEKVDKSNLEKVESINFNLNNQNLFLIYHQMINLFVFILKIQILFQKSNLK